MKLHTLFLFLIFVSVKKSLLFYFLTFIFFKCPFVAHIFNANLSLIWFSVGAIVKTGPRESPAFEQKIINQIGSHESFKFIYKFLVQVMNIGPTGNIIGSLDRFVVVTDLIIDFNNDEIQLQEFALKDVGRLSVRLTGSLLSWLISPLVTVFVRVFDGIIMRVVESTIRSVAHEAIGNINGGLREIVTGLESFN